MAFKNLGDLPTELVKMVFENTTDPVDRTMLATTCKDLQALGNIDMNAFWNDPDYAWEFLKRVDRDANPKLVPCRPCLSLHSPEVCLPSFTHAAGASYQCRSVRATHPNRDPTFVYNIQPALYGLVKYRKLGMDTAWLLETDKELRYRAQHDAIHYDHTLDLDNKFAPVAGHGGNVVFELTHVDLACECLGSTPRVIVQLDPTGTRLCSVYYAAENTIGPNGDATLANIPLDPTARGTVQGAIHSCAGCNTDLRAEIRYRPDYYPQLVLTSWCYKGDASTADALQAALDRVLYGGPGKYLPRLPGQSGHIAEMSGMML
ncbi:hypothetical protein PG991_001727 [Apiospora marii]|uniref:F-box domain-containing protein n=1 Tax=Apiospora marii TaxID=335849 RepID=A0ABR1SS79_9PEZI